jgi:hypothetical protein
VTVGASRVAAVQVGHESFWSTVAQLLPIAGIATVFAVQSAMKRVREDFEESKPGVVAAMVMTVGFLTVEGVALAVLSGVAPDWALLRGAATGITLGLLAFSALGPGYFLYSMRRESRRSERKMRLKVLRRRLRVRRATRRR